MNSSKNDIRESDIAIIAMSGRFPGAKDIDAFWENLRLGIESVSWFSDEELLRNGVHPEQLQKPNYVRAKAVLDDIELFDANFFGFNPKDAEILDPQQRLFLECAWEALEQAGYHSQTYAGSIGVYAGAGLSDYLLKNLYLNPAVSRTVSTYQLTLATQNDFLPTRVAYKLNFTGPAVNIQTACSTSLVAVHMACQSLLNGECDMALAGAVTIRIPQNEGYLYQEGMILSPDGHCRAFDAKAQGTLGGNGVGIVMLKRATDALADGDYIHAIIKGSAINNDGTNKIGFTAPSVEGQAAVIGEAQAIAGIDAETISYIEAHGTGTELGDPIEIAALTKAFHNSTKKKHFCAIGSVKTNIGHLDTAAGMAGLIKTVLALKHQQIPPTLHFENPNPTIDFANSPFYVNTKLSEWKSNGTPRRAGVSSFGIGGTNAHIVLEEAPVLEPRTPDETKSKRPYQLLVLSAKTSSALDTATKNLTEHFKQNPELNLADVAYTLSVGRQAFEHRRILVCSELDEAIRTLPEQVLTCYTKSSIPSVIFMFSGQGSQYVNMAREIYQTETIFREQVDRCAELLQPELGLDLRDILYPSPSRTEEATKQLQQTAITQPALFTIEYALAKLWESWGIQPQGFIGHSIGEYVAACLAGVFSLEDALCLVAARGRMMQQLPPGAMLSVPLAPEALEGLLGVELSIAAINEPSRCVVSGPMEAVANLQNQLGEQGIECIRLRTSHAFHSQMMEPILKPFAQRVKQVNLNSPQIPYLSNVTGKWITAAQATDPDYWAEHLRHTVQFALSLEELLKEPDQILLEVGSGQTLSTLVKRHPNKVASQVVLSSTRHPQQSGSDLAFLLTTLGQLWLAGVKVDWSGFYAQEQRYRVPLPTYPFERQRYWIEPDKNVDFVSATHVSGGKKPDIADWFYIPSWKRSIALALQPSKMSVQSCALVFIDQCGLGSQLVKQLELKGCDVITVCVGSDFTKLNDRTYTLNPGQRDDYDALLRELRALDNSLETIIHLWSVTPNSHTASGLEQVAKAQDLGFYSLLFLAQAIGAQNITEKLQVTVVSNNLQEVTGVEVLCPEKATLIGPVKVISQEYPNLSCRSIDIILPEPGTCQEAFLIDQLLNELQAKTSDRVIAYRGSHRWVQIFEPVHLDGSVEETPRLRKNGVYLITGGLGDIGLVLAEHLAKTVQAKLILTGRSAFPKPDEWGQWLANHDEYDSISRKIRKIRVLEELGAEILVSSADVANHQQMQELLTQVEERFGQLNGVIHAAGMTGEKTFRAIELTSQTECEQQFQPKVYGLLVLEKVLQERKLDFCLLLSSLSSVLGGLGFATYSAVNLFMDAFTHQHNQTNPVPWISVNWDGWQFGEQNKQSTSVGASLAELAITPQEGIKAFQRILSLGKVNQVVVSTGELQARINQWIKLEYLLSRAASRKVNSSSFDSKRKLQNVYVAPTKELEQTIAQIWQNFLGIESIGIYDDFFELGGDSLLGIQLTSKLSETLQEKISPNSLLNAPTIAALAEFLEMTNSSSATAKEKNRRLNSSLLVQLHKGSRQKQPFFLIHPVGGSVYSYRYLAHNLEADLPVYGLQARGLDGEGEPLTQIEAMAKSYLDLLQTVQPIGPYHLGGWSLGGLVAFEIAQQLHQQGQEVSQLVMIDSFTPTAANISSEIDEVSLVADFASYTGNVVGKEFSVSVAELKQLNSEEQLQYILVKARKFGVLPPEIESEQIRHRLEVFKANSQAMARYMPQPYFGRITFFCAEESMKQNQDPSLGWASVAAGSITTHNIPGNHYSIIESEILAHKLRAYLN